MACAVCGALGGGVPAWADLPSVSVSEETDLRFGSFAVFTGGWRAVGATGSQSSGGIMPVPGEPVGPAQFTVRYDRGTESSRPITVVLQLLLMPQSYVTKNGVTGQLSAFTTDLPGALPLVPGTAALVTLPSCTTRLCTLTFHVGARLDVTRSAGAAQKISFNLPISAFVISAL